MGLLHYISYIAVAATLCFVILSLASGLLYISELIEEHAKVAKYYGQKGIYVIIGLQTVLYLTESLPLHLTLFTVGCHLVYLQNFSSSWPLISLTSPTFIGSCVLVVTDHFLWFFHFTSRTASYNEQARRYGTRSAGTRLGFKEIASFFGICVWLAPLFLFLSLSANDNALPTTGSSESIAAASGEPKTKALLHHVRLCHH
ncbi:DUF396-domain-containing protein [Cylindrobasidium torrendii FP15055 ss-10]|uniref:DUF396-domain-containing protein n=1 Tax=Cylindrobasidium torrendii FP15055 ss-10 TaxID=1314674 RepID=A0A0D7BJG0_9AGAR|nr:DUF396-domain-containing protein [Cylindrobasidium torrendii FP15055 ss-10]